jgi:hypothetical protein
MIDNKYVNMYKLKKSLFFITHFSIFLNQVVLIYQSSLSNSLKLYANIYTYIQTIYISLSLQIRKISSNYFSIP